jgi:hypothetical protein
MRKRSYLDHHVESVFKIFAFGLLVIELAGLPALGQDGFTNA